MSVKWKAKYKQICLVYIWDLVVWFLFFSFYLWCLLWREHVKPRSKNKGLPIRFPQRIPFSVAGIPTCTCMFVIYLKQSLADTKQQLSLLSPNSNSRVIISVLGFLVFPPLFRTYPVQMKKWNQILQTGHIPAFSVVFFACLQFFLTLFNYYTAHIR